MYLLFRSTSTRTMNELRSFFPIVQKVLSCEDCSSSSSHKLLLTHNNEVRAYGGNKYGELGVGDNKDRSELTPVLFATPLTSKVIRVFTGDYNSAVITAEGVLYTFGYGYNGKLGTGKRLKENRATLIPLIGRAVQVAFGLLHTAILLEDGRLLICGNNCYGQLGLGDKSDQLKPTEVPLTGLVSDVKCSTHQTVITLENGELVEFGMHN